MKYKLGDFEIKIESREYNRFISKMSGYESQGKEDVSFSISKEDLDNEYEREDSYVYFNGEACFASVLRKLSEWLPQNNAFTLHSATFDVGGIGVAFSALSGTGKTTHMLNWLELLGEKMTIVNGDKPIVRFFDSEPNIPYAYGTPWMGKENLGCNMRTPLKHICFIERSEKNFVTKIEKKDAIERIMKQVYMPKDSVSLQNTLQLINRLIDCCELWIIHCNKDFESAEVAYKAIFKNK